VHATVHIQIFRSKNVARNKPHKCHMHAAGFVGGLQFSLVGANPHVDKRVSVCLLLMYIPVINICIYFLQCLSA